MTFSLLSWQFYWSYPLILINGISTGHEDATEDFGIYEFVSIPGKMESTQVLSRGTSQNPSFSLNICLNCLSVCATALQVSCRSLSRLESAQDLHTTIYDVIRHVPEAPSHSFL